MFHVKIIGEELKSLGWLILAILLAALFLKVASFFIRKYFEGKKDKAQTKEMVSVYQYSLVIIVIFTLVVIFSNIFRDVLASIGILAAGLAIALQRPILNVFGWFTIVVRKPFVIGDRVSIGPNKGDVFDISIMHTNMAELQDDALSGRMIAVPNELVLTQPVTNYTKGTPYVWDTLSIVLDQDSDVTKAAVLLKKVTVQAVGKLMVELSEKWTEVDGRKVTVKPEISTEIIVVNGISAVQLTSRYLCDVHERKYVRSKINSMLLSYIKKNKSVRFK